MREKRIDYLCTFKILMRESYVFNTCEKQEFIKLQSTTIFKFNYVNFYNTFIYSRLFYNLLKEELENIELSMFSSFCDFSSLSSSNNPSDSYQKKYSFTFFLNQRYMQRSRLISQEFLFEKRGSIIKMQVKKNCKKLNKSAYNFRYEAGAMVHS